MVRRDCGWLHHRHVAPNTTSLGPVPAEGKRRQPFVCGCASDLLWTGRPVVVPGENVLSRHRLAGRRRWLARVVVIGLVVALFAVAFAKLRSHTLPRSDLY